MTAALRVVQGCKRPTQGWVPVPPSISHPYSPIATPPPYSPSCTPAGETRTDRTAAGAADTVGAPGAHRSSRTLGTGERRRHRAPGRP